MVSKNSSIDVIPIPVVNGGSGAATLTGVLTGNGTSAITANAVTEHGILIAGAANAVGSLSVAATGTILAGVTGADPAFTATPSGLTSLTAASLVTSSATLGTTYTDNTISATGSDANININITPKGSGSIIYSASRAATDLNMQITNSDNTAASSPAGIQLAVGGSTNTGDPYTQYTVSGAQTWTTGIDNSASDAYVIAASNALGTSNAASWSTAGALTNTAGITASTGDIVATAGAITAGTTLTATLGAITATNGNLVLNTAGNKIVSTSVGTTTAAGANSFGSVTLVGGTATVSTTSVTANSLIYIWRQSIGATGAAALGHLTVGTITAATSFVINAVQAADATALQASDVSVVGWMIVN